MSNFGNKKQKDGFSSSQPLPASPYQGRSKGGVSLHEGVSYFSYKKVLIEKARENRKNPTEAEKRIWTILRNKQLSNFKFLRQKPIDGFIVDFYCSELLLAVEIDGDSHFFQEEYDKLRTNKLNSLGIKVVRYTNNDVINCLDGVYNDMKRIIELRIPTPPNLPLSGEESNPPQPSLVREGEENSF